MADASVGVRFWAADRSAKCGVTKPHGGWVQVRSDEVPR
jgi:hypothetical protein